MSTTIDLHSGTQRELIDFSATEERVDVYDNPVDAYLDTLSSQASHVTMTSLLGSIARTFGFNNPRDVPWRLFNDQAIIKMLAMLRREKYSQPTMDTESHILDVTLLKNHLRK